MLQDFACLTSKNSHTGNDSSDDISDAFKLALDVLFCLNKKQILILQ